MRLGRLRRAPKGPLAVAGILATPLFFVGLMAFALKLDEPTAHVSPGGKEVLGDPAKRTVLLIYLAALAVCGIVVLAGLVGMFVGARTGVLVPSFVAIVVSIAYRIPLATWEDAHTARYPQGVDLIPKSDPGDLFLRGEWEENAHRTADQLSFWTIALSVAAVALALVLEARRRRGLSGPRVPPPPEVAGDPQIVPQAHDLP